MRMFSVEVSDYQDTDGGEKNYGCLVDYCFKSAVSSIRILMEENKPVVAQIQKFEY